MLKRIMIVLAIMIGFFAHAKYTFSESHMEKWLVNLDSRIYSGDPNVCDAFTNDIEIEVYGKTNTEESLQISGKDKWCPYLRLVGRGFSLAQIEITTSYDNLHVKPSKFPWREATVTYTETDKTSMQGAPTVEEVKEDTLVVVRTLKGLKIKSMESDIKSRRITN
ncbi:MAG: hypothetical protein ACAH12_09380 [Methylophilaceae bacterium]